MSEITSHSKTIADNPPGSRVNNIYSPDSDKLTEEQLCMPQLYVNQAAG